MLFRSIMFNLLTTLRLEQMGTRRYTAPRVEDIHLGSGTFQPIVTTDIPMLINAISDGLGDMAACIVSSTIKHQHRIEMFKCSVAASCVVATSHFIIPMGIVATSASHVIVYFVLVRLLPQRTRLCILTDFVEMFTLHRDRGILNFIRNKFRWSENTRSVAGPGRPNSNHAHPKAADLRRNGTITLTSTIRNMAVSMPGEVNGRFDVATSNRENKNEDDIRGERLLHDTSDMRQEKHYDEPQQGDIVTMVDVDYYFDDWSRFAGRTIMLYTRIPNSIAEREHEATIVLEEREGMAVMTEIVDGVATWESGIWDYSADCVTIKHKWGFGFTVYACEKIRQGASSRYIVALVPQSTISLPYNLVRGVFWLLGVKAPKIIYKELSRANNVWGVKSGAMDLALARFRRNGKDYVDMRPKGLLDSSSTYLLTKDFLTIQTAVKGDKNCGTIANLKSWFNQLNYGDDPRSPGKTSNPILWSHYFNSGDTKVKEPMRLNYVFTDTENPFETGKPLSQLVHEPIVDNVLVSPTRSMANDVKSVQTRVLDKENNVVPDRKYKAYAKSFVRALAPKRGALHPVEQQVVLDNMKAPLQVARKKQHDKALDTASNKVNGDMKKEGYNDVKDPRMISGVHITHTVGFGRYMYAVKQYMRKFEWFMPCCNPTEFAERIHNYCSDREVVVETDYSRFDGTISEFLTEVERNVYRSMFAKEHSPELEKFLKADRQLTAYTRSGVTYKTGWARLSGSQSTTVGNTIINAFVAYCAYRNAGKSHKESIADLGPKYGDDGIDANITGFTATGEALGLKIKEIKRRTNYFVTFCGRYYINPKYSKTSIFNVVKAMQSLPVVHDVEPCAPLAKLLGYLAVDPYTPLLSHYVRAAFRVYGYDVNNERVRKLMNRDRDLVWKVDQGPFPYDAGDNNNVLRVIAHMFDVDPSTIQSLCDRLDAARTPQDMQSIPKLTIATDAEQSDLQFVGETTTKNGIVTSGYGNRKMNGNKGGRSGPKFSNERK